MKCKNMEKILTKYQHVLANVPNQLHLTKTAEQNKTPKTGKVKKKTFSFLFFVENKANGSLWCVRISDVRTFPTPQRERGGGRDIDRYLGVMCYLLEMSELCYGQ